MAANKEPIFVGQILGKGTVITGNSGASAITEVFSGDSVESTRLDSLTVYTNETVARDVYIVLDFGGAAPNVCTVSLPAFSGSSNAVAPLNILAQASLAGLVKFDAAGNRFLNLPPGAKIKAQLPITNTAAFTYQFSALGGKY